MFTFARTRIPVSSRRRNPELATTRAGDEGELGTQIPDAPRGAYCKYALQHRREYLVKMASAPPSPP